MSDYNREVEAEILGVVEDASATIKLAFNQYLEKRQVAK